MSFKEIDIKDEYRSKADDVAHDFYYPILKNAVAYDRAVGFFSSTALIAIAEGVLPFVKNAPPLVWLVLLSIPLLSLAYLPVKYYPKKTK